MRNSALLFFLSLLLCWCANAQLNTQNDLIGTWEVQRCELYIEGKLIKTGNFNSSEFDSKQVEGKDAGKIEDDVNRIIKEILGCRITFNNDSTVSSAAIIEGLSLNNEYWQLGSEGELLICKKENRKKMKPLLFNGRVNFLSKGEIMVEYFESGFQLRLFFFFV